MIYPELTDEEIENLINESWKEIASAKGDLKKDKLKVIGRTLIVVIVVAGGVVVSVLFPNPITIGALGGVMAIATGNKGFLRRFKKVREKSKKKKKDKVKMKNMIVEKGNRKTARDIRSRISFMETQVLEPPSAPKLYPDLSGM